LGLNQVSNEEKLVIAMIGIGNSELLTTGFMDKYLDWLINILKFTGMTFSSIFLILFIIYLIINVLLNLLSDIPIIKGVLRLLEYLLIPGPIMHSVWHVFAAKKLNIQTEHQYNFGFAWSRSAIKLVDRLKNLREAVIFFWAPIMNIFVIVFWVFPGIFLFQWLDSLLDRTVFYWIWLYILLSLVIFGLPSVSDLLNPLQITIVKTPEFYLFVIFYVILAPITLVLWGYGMTIIFSLGYAIIAFYEVHKIAKKEENRLAKSHDKILQKTKTVYILTDSNTPE